MQKLFVAASRKFFNEVKEVVRLLKHNQIDVKLPNKKLGDDSFDSEKKALFNAFQLIEECDFVYVFTKNGYVGKTVATEAGFAFAKGKEIIASEKISEPSVQALVSRKMKPAELIEYLKKQ